MGGICAKQKTVRGKLAKVAAATAVMAPVAPVASCPPADQGAKTRVILVAGPPAVGKGTQCELIIAAYGLVHISPGEILRDHVKRGTDLGNAAKEYMDSGQLVPGDVVIRVVKERLRQADVANRGCLLDNFPLTAEQAEAMKGHIDPDLFLLLEAPKELLFERAVGRRLDPQTGVIYHMSLNPPPHELKARLERRTDDNDSLVAARLNTYQRHIDAIVPVFAECVHRIDGNRPPKAVFSSIAGVLDAHGWGPTDDEPYCGSKAFGGCFSAKDAQVAGFYSPLNPPEEGDEVVCFERGVNWQRRGRVVAASEQVSDGTCGLKKGIEGMMVIVERETALSSPKSVALLETALSTPKSVGLAGTSSFCSWAVFLAPLNDMEYSSVCTTGKFQASHFCRLYHCAAVFGDARCVSFEDARKSVESWIANLEDADGEPIEVSTEVVQTVLSLFDTQESPSLYLYSTNVKIGLRTSRILGLDFSIYYRALNNTLNNDKEESLQRVMPLIQHMVYDILYTSDGKRRLHRGGRLWKGDAQRPVPLNMQKLTEAAALGSAIRFRQFQSTTSDDNLARKYRRREDSCGFMWTIDVPEFFWGARDISDVSWRKGESETLFPPYAAFVVKRVDKDGCQLQAVDFSCELQIRAQRHGLRGTAVELLSY